MSSNDEVDGWIAQLMQCKPLSETEVKKLCDKVGQATLDSHLDGHGSADQRELGS